MGDGNDGLFLSEVGVGTVSGGTGPVGGAATLKVGGGNDTIVIVGVGTLAAGDSPGSPPDGEMGSFTLTTGNGNNDVLISLDWLGSESDGYTAGPAYGIDPAMQAYIATSSAIAGTLQAVDEELDSAAEVMLSNGTEESLDASHAYLTIGERHRDERGRIVGHHGLPKHARVGGDEPFGRPPGGGADYLYFYDNAWDGAFVNLNGGKGAHNTLDEYRGGNEGGQFDRRQLPDYRPRRDRLTGDLDRS